MKALRYFFYLISIFMLLGVTISTLPILPPPREIISLEDKGAPKVDLSNKVKEIIESSKVLDEVPDWVKGEAMRQATNTSYKTGIQALSAWRQRKRFTGTLDERGFMENRLRPSPLAPDEPGEALIHNDWNGDIRVNNDPSYQQFHPSVCLGTDGVIYVAWAQKINNDNYWIYFAKSTNWGDSWTTPVLIDNYGINNRTDIACYGTGSTADVYVTYTYWYDPSNYDYDIYCGVSNNGGASFTVRVVQNSTNYEDMSTVATDASGYAYVAFCYGWVAGGGCDPSTAESEVLMKYSSNRGASWSSAYYLTNYTGEYDDFLPAIALQGGGASSIMHFAWVHDMTTTGGNYNVWYKRITNAGSSPSIPSGYITIAGASDQEYVVTKGIAVGPDGNPQIAYCLSNASNGNGDIYYRRSNDGGTSFASARLISGRTTEEVDARIVIDAQNNPAIAWRDARNGHTDIYLTYSDDQGSTWRGEFIANRDLSSSQQYWPALGICSQGWRRFLAVVWWDTRSDDGDIFFNANQMIGVSLNVSYIPTIPPAPRPGFRYRAFEVSKDTSFNSAGTYRIWWDPEYASDPLLDETWAGSSSTERWATVNPGGWLWLAPRYFTPPDTGGSYNVPYYRQFRVIFSAGKGNPPACTHTIPNLDVTFYQFGNLLTRTVSDAVSCTAWVDHNSTYRMPGWRVLSPVQRWACNSADTIGTITSSRTVRPIYYHQWFPLVMLVGPTSTNWAFTERHTQFGASHLESELYNEWQQWTDCGTVVDFSDTTVPNGWYAIDPTSWTCLTYDVRTIRYSNNSRVTVRNDFGYGSVIVDGSTYPSPYSTEWGAGTVHTIGAISPQTFGDTIRYVFNRWSDGGAISHSVTATDRDMEFIAFFNKQYKINLAYTGPTGGHVPTMTGAGWYNAGSLANISTTISFDSTGTIRYGFSHWTSSPPGAVFADSTSPTTTVIVNRTYTITAVYRVQFRLDVSSMGGYGRPSPPVGSSWFNSGTYVCASAGSPDTIYHMYTTGWTGTGCVPASGSASSVCFTMSSPGTITWRWANQLTLTVISTYGLPTPSVGVHYYDPGTYVLCSVPTPFYLSPSIRTICTGYTGTGGIGSGSGNSVGFNIATNCSLTWNWQLQYKLTIVNPGGYGSPIPPAGDNWFNAGAIVMARVLSPHGSMVCIGFNGTPPTLPSSSPHDSVVFAMIAPATLTWLWVPIWEAYSLTVIDSGLGSPYPYGVTWYLPGTLINAYVTSPFPDPLNPGIRHICTGFTGTGSCPSGSGSSTGPWYIWSNSVLRWHWTQQYRLLIRSVPGYYGNPVPDTGASWYNPGTTVYGMVTSPWEDSIFCTGFIGSGSAPPSSPSTFFNFRLDTPSSVTWQWSATRALLTVNSPYGSPNPPVGTHSYAIGSVINLSVGRYFLVSPTELWKCIGWTGTGSVPASGTDTSVTITLLVNSSITWNWVRMHRVDIDNPGDWDTPVPSAGQHWFPDGTWLHCYITHNPVGDMYCVGYYGSGSCPSAWGVDEVIFRVDMYSTLQWVWLHVSSIESLIVNSAYGTPFPSVGVHYFPRGVLATCYLTDCIREISGEERYRAVGYTGTGSAPSGTDTIVYFPIMSPSTITWNWQHQYTFEVQNPGGYDTPVPPVGTHWFADGATVNAWMTTNPIAGMACVGYHGWGSLSPGLGDSVSFVLRGPSGIRWNWAPLSSVYTLEVISPYSPCYPPIGVNYILPGTIVNANAGPFNYLDPVRRRRVSSYIGTGCVPAWDDTNAVTFNMTSNGTITWRWDNESYLALSYSGCGSAVPEQTGEGWHKNGDTVIISTSPSVMDGPITYGFLNWTPRPFPAAIVIEPTWNTTDVAFMAPCTINAAYTSAIACTLRKEPPQAYGGFIVDGVLHDRTSIFTAWWAAGSVHTVAVTSPDTGGGGRYIFDRWSDGGAISHTVGPIMSPLNLTAYYNSQYKLHIEKNPFHTQGYLIVGDSTYVGVGSISRWLDEGTSILVGASAIDTVSVAHRYYWSNWSDGGAINHIIEPIYSSTNLIANYNSQFRLKVKKSPAQSYGWIMIDDSLYEFTSSASRWFMPGAVHEVRVSRYDIRRDSAYQFLNFNGVVSDSIQPKTIELSAPDTIIAYYRGYQFYLGVNVTPAEWRIGEVPTSFIRTMFPAETISVINTGNIPIDCGLSLVLPDTLTAWACGCLNGRDRFVLRAHFSDNPTPPPIFHSSFDCVKESNTWASNILFGTQGWFIRPDEKDKLWLQFQAPSSSSPLAYGVEQKMILRIMVRVTLY